MKQSDAMRAWAGDNWLKRNRNDLGKLPDPVEHWIEKTKIINNTSNVLEIGCANGWRLKKLQDKYGCAVVGVDPSPLACAEAWQLLKIAVSHTTAAALPYDDENFDVVIMGFCMWLTEPSEWLRNVSESDRVLKDGGLLMIYDYCYPRAFKRPYKFDEESAKHDDAWCFFFDWPKLWLAHPGYQTVLETIDADSHHIISMLRKDMTGALGG